MARNPSSCAANGKADRVIIKLSFRREAETGERTYRSIVYRYVCPIIDANTIETLLFRPIRFHEFMLPRHFSSQRMLPIVSDKRLTILSGWGESNTACFLKPCCNIMRLRNIFFFFFILKATVYALQVMAKKLDRIISILKFICLD